MLSGKLRKGAGSEPEQASVLFGGCLDSVDRGRFGLAQLLCALNSKIGMKLEVWNEADRTPLSPASGAIGRRQESH